MANELPGRSPVPRLRAKVVATTAAKLGALDRITDRLDLLDVWTRPEPGSRKPRLTRDDIAAAAIRIADAEGFDAVSMRRIAAELGAGTMTLYHYVRTKDELLTLVTDAFMAEVALPRGEELPKPWRDALGLIARRTRDALFRHPWLLDISDDPAFGPNGMRHFDQSLQALSSLKLSFAEKIEVISSIDEFVFGYCLQYRNNNFDQGQPDHELLAYVDELLATGEYPELVRLAAERPMTESWQVMQRTMSDPARFDRSLSRLLDGVERDLVRRR